MIDKDFAAIAAAIYEAIGLSNEGLPEDGANIVAVLRRNGFDLRHQLDTATRLTDGSKSADERRENEDMTSFTIRRIRNETLEAAARTVLSEAVTPDANPDPTDVSYNIALQHAAEAVLRMRT